MEVIMKDLSGRLHKIEKRQDVMFDIIEKQERLINIMKETIDLYNKQQQVRNEQ